MTQRLAGKTAFLTAAGQGIGRATALAFVREGARVIATDVNAEALASLAEESGCTTLQLDVLDPVAISAAAQAHGRHQILRDRHRLRVRLLRDLLGPLAILLVLRLRHRLANLEDAELLLLQILVYQFSHYTNHA